MYSGKSFLKSWQQLRGNEEAMTVLLSGGGGNADQQLSPEHMYRLQKCWLGKYYIISALQGQVISQVIYHALLGQI